MDSGEGSMDAANFKGCRCRMFCVNQLCSGHHGGLP